MGKGISSSTPNQGRAFERKRMLDVIAMIWLEQNDPIECVCRDVSTSGLLVESKEDLPIGKHLRVSLHNNQNKEHIGSLVTQVIRTQKNKWGGFNIGLEIIHNQE